MQSPGIRTQSISITFLDGRYLRKECSFRGNAKKGLEVTGVRQSFVVRTPCKYTIKHANKCKSYATGRRF